jgi:hypothetical protein
VNTHARFVGAIHAVVLSLFAAITIAMLYVLFSPLVARDDLAEHCTVTVTQLPA